MYKRMPFGKYTGLSLQEVVEDRDYVKWLLTTPNLAEQYPDTIISLIELMQKIKNKQGKYFRDISDLNAIQEENLMQLKFLQKDFLVNFVKELLPDYKSFDSKDLKLSQLQFEANNCAVSFDLNTLDSKITHFAIWIFYEINDDYRSLVAKINNYLSPIDDTVKILYTKHFVANHIHEEKFTQLLDNQGITIKYEPLDIPYEEDTDFSTIEGFREVGIVELPKDIDTRNNNDEVPF